MTNRVLDEYLARVRAELADLTDTDREAVVDDMRGHLEQAISDRLDADPSADLEAVALEETRAFGDPAEIAAARGASARPAAGPPRARRLPRWAWGLLAAAILVMAAVALADLADRASQPDVAFPYARSNAYTNQTGLVNETFLVPPNAELLWITVEVARDDGCLGLRVTDPRGSVVLDEWDTCGAMHHTLDFRPQVSGQSGEWRVELRHRDFTGHLEIDAHATLVS